MLHMFMLLVLLTLMEKSGLSDTVEVTPQAQTVHENTMMMALQKRPLTLVLVILQQ